jgi:hypothetical protein
MLSLSPSRVRRTVLSSSPQIESAVRHLGIEVDDHILPDDAISPIVDLVGGALSVADRALRDGSQWHGVSVNTAKRPWQHFRCWPSAEVFLDRRMVRSWAMNRRRPPDARH